MLKKQLTLITTLVLGFAIAVAPRASSANLLGRLVLVQLPSASPGFPLPSTVPKGTTVRIDGSSSMEIFNQSLKQRFEGQFPGTAVELETQGIDSALKALREGKIDVAAIGRALTDAEKAQGLVATPLARAKIAIIVGADNPFSGNLTFDQFAKIFRGEITNWSAVGGKPGVIRFIDRPKLSDTRQAFTKYPVFRGAPFTAGATAVTVSQDTTAEVIKALGNDGISYAIANQVLNQKSVKIVPMHGTLPDDPRYPYSQPLAYVHKATANPAAQAFLGFVMAPPGQAAIQAANAGAIALGAGASMAGLKASPPLDLAINTPTETGSPAASTGAGKPSPIGTAAGTTAPAASNQAMLPNSGDTAGTSVFGDGMPLWWWLVPLLGVGLGLWWWLKGRRANQLAATDSTAPLPTTGVTPIAPAGDINPVAPPPTVDLSGPPIPEGLDGAALAGGAALAAGVATGLADESAIVSPLASPADLSEVADPAVFDLPHPAFLQATDVTAATAAGAAVPEEADWVSLDAVEFGEGTVETAGEDLDAQVIDFGSSDIGSSDIASSVTGKPITEMSANVRGATDSPGISAVQLGGTLLSAGAGVGAAALAAESEHPSFGITEDIAQTQVEAAKFDVGATEDAVDLSDVDAGLSDLPDGYGESRIVLLPRDPQAAYAYWDTPNEHKAELRQQGGQQLALRLCDVTDLDVNYQAPHSIQQYDCDEMARDWYLPIPISDRDYIVEIGYLTSDGRWLMLARSLPVRVPPVYPSDWFEERFLTIEWEQNLRGREFLKLVPPNQRPVTPLGTSVHEQMFALAGGLDAMRSAGSLFGSMQQVPVESLSSFVFPSGMGLWALPTLSGMGMSGVGMSGVGFSASMPPIRSRQFWLVADAELIIYGATEPDATVTIGSRPITLNPDGTFRFQMPFYDGQLDFPIWATAVDGEQTRSIQMKFTRETPQRRTNTKEEAQDEWF